MARWTPRLTSVKVIALSGEEWEAGPGPGDLSIGGENAENAEHIKKLNRGKHDGFVVGDDMVQDVSLTIELPNVSLTDPIVTRAHDVFKKQGSWAAVQSVDPTIWAFKMLLTLSDGTTTATKELPICEGEASFSEAKEGTTFSFSGRNHGPIVEG